MNCDLCSAPLQLAIVRHKRPIVGFHSLLDGEPGEICKLSHQFDAEGHLTYCLYGHQYSGSEWFRVLKLKALIRHFYEKAFI